MFRPFVPRGHRAAFRRHPLSGRCRRRRSLLTLEGSPARTGTPPPGAPDTVTLQYPNSDVADILRLYETLTGKKLIMDNFVQGKVNIFVARPIPRDEAIKIIEINLLMNGYSLVPAGGDLVKVIGTGTKPAQRRRADHLR